MLQASLLAIHGYTHMRHQVIPRTVGKSARRQVTIACACSVLLSKLPPDFYVKLSSCIEVLVHPLVFVHLNQLAFTGSELSGARSPAGGLSEKLDNLIADAATEGLPQHLKVRVSLICPIPKQNPAPRHSTKM